MSSASLYSGPQGTVRVALPFALADLLAGWKRVGAAMLREFPAEFTRDEWAYLATFLSESNLRLPFARSFGAAADGGGESGLLARPRGRVALWLPNNVSLLGPLMLIVVSLTGNRLRIKAGSRSEDLTGVFLEFVRRHAGQGVLGAYVTDSVRHEVFSADDPRNLEMAAEAAIRIMFGSDDTAAAIDALPHPADSISIAFVDRRSEAWLEPERCDEATLRDLIRVFAIYGLAGCTSPARAVLMDADRAAALDLRDRLVELWPSVIRGRPEMNVASENLRALQVARAAGWDARLVADGRAVVSVGEHALPTYPAQLELRVVPASRAQAREGLPDNIQTIGHALLDASAPEWLDMLATTNVLRFVPLGTMHHFETVWDGRDFFVELFTCTRVTP
jgi:hypothetical protein